MKTLTLILIGFCLAARAEINLTLDDQIKISKVIYQIEGGDKTKHPYGIKSIKTFGDKQLARRICLNTIKNNFIVWKNSGARGEFTNYLCDAYCPPESDFQGNINWKKNFNQIAKKQNLNLFKNNQIKLNEKSPQAPSVQTIFALQLAKINAANQALKLIGKY